MAAEWVHTFDFNRANIGDYVTYAGREYWDEAAQASDGRGILVLCGHFGNWELQFVAHSLYGTSGAIVQRPNRNPVLDAAVMARRERFGSRAIPRRGAGRNIMRLLRDNWMVAIPLDLDTRQGIFVDFFSLKAATTDALARLALACRAPVLPFFMIREGSTHRHRATFLPMIETIRSGDRDADVLANTQRYTAVIETMIRQHPDHWNWIHRRWKTRPPGEPRFY
jgi:KDO2-lipid IV(A) lauroyltransferase